MKVLICLIFVLITSICKSEEPTSFASIRQTAPIEVTCCEGCKQALTVMLETIKSLDERITKLENRTKPAIKVKKIIMHSLAVCPSCEIWKRDEAPVAIRKGYEVNVVIDRGEPGKVYPWFEILDGDQSKVIPRYFSSQTL